MSINAVAPLAGAWIEIHKIQPVVFMPPSLPSRERGLKFSAPCRNGTKGALSLPSRERGLKWSCSQHVKGQGLVAPLAGAWIEISPALYTSTAANVAPLAGAWIEIAALFFTAVPIPVAPLAGAWIEIGANERGH